jgi:phage shock protein A
MRPYLEEILAFSRQKTEAWRGEAAALGDLVGDVSLYAAERLKQRYRSTPREADSFANVLSQLVIDAANELIEARKQVFIAVADEKRLVKQAEEEAAKSLEWGRRAARAEAAGDAALTREARAREREHAETTLSIKALWTRQATSVAALKSTLRALDGQIAEAKRRRTSILAARAMSRAHEDMRRTERRMAETIRLLGRLSEIANQVEGDPAPIDDESPSR